MAGPADADNVRGLAGLRGVVDEARAVAPCRRQDPLPGRRGHLLDAAHPAAHDAVQRAAHLRTLQRLHGF